MHSQETIRHPKLKVTIKDGAEGPAHDPYHYSEYWITTPRGVTVYHRGALASYMTHNGHKVEFVGWPKELGNDDLQQFIENGFIALWCGYSIKQLHRIFRKRTERCRSCGSRKFVRVQGHPGETFFACRRCETISTGYVSLGGII